MRACDGVPTGCNPIGVTVGQRRTEAQRERLRGLASNAFVELRALCSAGHLAQPGALAEAFHNLPSMLDRDRFDWNQARKYLENYAAEYPDGAGYLAEFDAIPR